MDSYSRLAECYDLFMEEVPYEKWLKYILSRFDKYNVPRELVLDLGCGTGTMTELLANAGYDMIGIDISEEMLEMALEKKEQSGHDILYLNQDMREFELYGTVRAIISICDSVNYILEEEELLQTFKLVNNYLDPKGIFIFDFNTVYKYEQVIGDVTIAENRDDYSFIWENYYHDKEHINEYDLTIFSSEGELYRKSVETHYQRGYTADEMRKLIEDSGLILLEMTDADSGHMISDETERIHVVAQENGKSKEEQ